MMAEERNNSSWKTYVRSEANYSDVSDRFVLETRSFQRQYAHIYAARLWSMRPKLEADARKKWGAKVVVRRLSELQLGEDCVIIGTLYKQMELKPNILKEISEQNGLMVPPPGNGSHSRYTDPSDELILEDEVQRVALVGEVDIQLQISGTVVAVYGHQPDDCAGKFIAKGVIFPSLPKQIPRPLVEQDKFVAFLSGLDIGSPSDDPFSRQLLIDSLTGSIGDEDFQERMSHVVRVIIAGNSLSDCTRDRGAATRAKYLSKKTAAGTKEAIVVLDDFIAQLAAGVSVDLMPGEFDPSCFTLPQQPLHRCMFPQSAAFATMHCVTNPYEFVVDGTRILGMSGQPVADVVKFTAGLENHLDVLERTLVAGHIAPTAPDTLACYPYADTDPFIVESSPHMLFSGNAPDYGSKVFHGDGGQTILLLAIPRFSESKTVVLVNLRNMDCQPYVISSGFASDPVPTDSVENMDSADSHSLENMDSSP